jgi:AraC-like DNA-binding protein
LYVLYVEGRERVKAWKPPVPGIREVFHAHFVDHAYPPHTHDTWTILLLDAGQVTYDLDRRHLEARPSTVTVLPPYVAHDGRAATTAGYRKRVLYLDTTVLDESLIGQAVDSPIVEDRALRASLDGLHRSLTSPDDALAAETQLAFVAERLRNHLTRRIEAATTLPAGSDLADQLRALLDDRLGERVTLAAAGAELHATPAHLVRTFHHTFGLPPHAYLLGRRIEAARHLLLAGEPIAQVAAGVGFVDQSHLTRHFKRHVGATPARYAAAGLGSGRARRGQASHSSSSRLHSAPRSA